MKHCNLSIIPKKGTKTKPPKKRAVFEMLVPPLEEQDEIADYLDTALAKID